MGKSKPFPKRLADFCTKQRMARIGYLCAMTSITTGFIIFVLLVVEILVPYLKIHTYVDSTCVTVNGFYTVGDFSTGWLYKQPSWPLCGTGRKPMYYPCARIEVVHEWKGQKVFGLLHEDEYNLIDAETEPAKNCSFSKCTISTRENGRDIHGLMLKYGRKNDKFSCLVDPTKPSRIVLRFYHTQKDTLMAVLIPAGIFLLGIITTIVMACAIGCEIWGQVGYGATAQWEKSIKWTQDNPPKSKGFPQICRTKQSPASTVKLNYEISSSIPGDMSV